MSLEKMVGLHPDVQQTNTELVTAVRHAMLCSLMCTSCADACSAEAMDMAQCIRTCMDCADVCNAVARLGIRRTGQNVEVLRTMLEACAHTCEICAGECAKHEHEHCRLCAEMCRECAADCRGVLPSIH